MAPLYVLRSYLTFFVGGRCSYACKNAPGDTDRGDIDILPPNKSTSLTTGSLLFRYRGPGIILSFPQIRLWCEVQKNISLSTPGLSIG